jgi:hypothetical protein
MYEFAVLSLFVVVEIGGSPHNLGPFHEMLHEEVIGGCLVMGARKF